MFGIEPDISLIDFDNIPNNIMRVDSFWTIWENLI